MKKFIILFSILILAVFLAACGSSNTDTNTASTAVLDTAVAQGEGTGERGAFSGELPEATRLIIGTFQLEETVNAVDTEQAAELLPLWQVYKSLMESDITATEEINALTDQIAETMTAEQMQAIEAMEISFEDMAALNQTLGLSSGFQRVDGTSEEGEDIVIPDDAVIISGEFVPGEGVPGSGNGNGPGGGGRGQSMGDATGLSSEEIESLQATMEASGGRGGFGGGMGSMVSTELIDALIELLQSK